MDHSRVNDLKAVQVETTTLMGKFVEGFGEVESILRTLIESFNRMQEQLDNQPKVDTSTLHAGVR
jgi:flagellar biosynthesis chaperone FliJ